MILKINFDEMTILTIKIVDLSLGVRVTPKNEKFKDRFLKSLNIFRSNSTYSFYSKQHRYQ